MNENLTFQSPPSAYRWLWISVSLVVACLLGYGYYLQYVEYLDPCPLCMTQRFFYYCLGICGIIGFLAYRSWTGQRWVAFFAFTSAVGGIVTAGRQVWMQHLPSDQVPACGPGLMYWLENMPWLKTLELLFKGDGNCAEVNWRFLGLSIGEWSLAWFVLFALVALCVLFTPKQTTLTN
jgi:disulfide bond formation protein DsbB